MQRKSALRHRISCREQLLSDSLALTEAVGRKPTCGERGGVVQVHSPQQLFAFVDLSLRRFSTSAAMRTTGNAHGWAKPGAPIRLTGSPPAAATTMIAANQTGGGIAYQSEEKILEAQRNRRVGGYVRQSRGCRHRSKAQPRSSTTLVRLTLGCDATHFQELNI